MKSLIGASSNASLRAAKKLVIPKAVYRLGNVDSEYAASDVQDYVKGLGIRVLTCFELPQSVRQSAGNKAFRICIIVEDKPKLFDSSNWNVGVSVREWRHKPSQLVDPEGGDGVNPTGIIVTSKGQDAVIISSHGQNEALSRDCVVVQPAAIDSVVSNGGP